MSESSHDKSHDQNPALSSEERLRRADIVREKAGVSLGEARDALEACGYDVLDALVALERRGAAAPGQTASCSTAQTPPADDVLAMSAAQSTYEDQTKKVRFEEGLARVTAWLRRALRKLVDVSFVASRRGRKVASIPLLLFIVLLVVFFWVTLPLLVIGLFCEFRYRLEGVGAVTIDVNEWSERASDGVDALKKDVMDARDEKRSATSEKGDEKEGPKK